MLKMYTEPELEVRKYSVTESVFTDSDPSGNNDNDLNNDDEYDYFGNN